MLETLTNLDRIGVKHTGAGRNFVEARTPAIVERDGCEFGTQFIAHGEAMRVVTQQADNSDNER